MDNYEILGHLSQGRFGSVSRARSRAEGDDQEVAIKEVYYRECSRKVSASGDVFVEQTDDWTRSVLRELATLGGESQPERLLVADDADGTEGSSCLEFL